MIEHMWGPEAKSLPLIQALTTRIKQAFLPSTLRDADPGLPRTFSEQDIAEQRYGEFLEETTDFRDALNPNQRQYYKQITVSSTQIKQFLSTVERYRHTVLDNSPYLTWYKDTVLKPLNRLAANLLFNLAVEYKTNIGSRETPSQILDTYRSLQLIIPKLESETTHEAFFENLDTELLFTSTLNEVFNSSADFFHNQSSYAEANRQKTQLIQVLKDPSRFCSWLIKHTRQLDQMSLVLETIDELEVLDDEQKSQLQFEALEQRQELQVKNWKLELMIEISRVGTFDNLQEIIEEAAANDPPLLYLSSKKIDLNAALEMPIEQPIPEWEQKFISPEYTPNWSGEVIEFLLNKFQDLCKVEIRRATEYANKHQYNLEQFIIEKTDLLENLTATLLTIRVHENMAPARWYHFFLDTYLKTKQEFLQILIDLEE